MVGPSHATVAGSSRAASGQRAAGAGRLSATANAACLRLPDRARATAADEDATNNPTANHSERHMKLNVKCSNGKTLNLDIDGASTVLELKEAISAEDGNPPATQQRLIYSGKVLKDPETLDSYAVQEGHTIHMVRGAAPPASAPAPHAMIEREVRIEL